MRYVIFEPNESYKVAILIKTTALNKAFLLEHYVEPMGIDKRDVIAIDVEYNERNKSPAPLIKECLERLMPVLDELKVDTVLVADGPYYKAITKQKADMNIGNVVPCSIKGYEHLNVVSSVNYQALFHNPTYSDRITRSIETVKAHLTGVHEPVGKDIIHYALYPETVDEIASALHNLHHFKELTCDIEAYALKHYSAGIGSIAFAWSEHEGIAFGIDFLTGHKPNHPVRKLLKQFFIDYEGTITWHNIGYDAKVIIYQLWMEDILDQHGLLEGLEVMTKNFDDTKIIAYLATNSCAGNELGLKTLAQEFVGNYAIDVKDIKTQSLSDLLKYNLMDCMATAWIKKKYYPMMVNDQQEELYQGLFKDSVKNLLHVELTGMPLCMARVHEVDKQLSAIYDGHVEALLSMSPVLQTQEKLKALKWEKDYQDRRAKAKNPDKIDYKDYDTFKFSINLGSGQQVAVLLYEVLGMPILDKTDTGLPATGAKEIKKLRNHTDDQECKDIIDHLLGMARVSKILEACIPALKTAVLGKDGIHYLFGSFNLGGAVSGRLSSSGPNLQQIPSKGELGKLIKSCFNPKGEWLFCSADFASLEERINTLLTKDRNKILVYKQGFDGHSFRAVRYWPQEFPGIDPNDPIQVNAIDKTPHGDKRRSDGKAPTFAMQFFGTAFTLRKNCGFSNEESDAIVANYETMYQDSIIWADDQLEIAAGKGYATAAFGLRIRCPTMHQVVWNRDRKKLPRAAAAEARTLGNALSGQSYGLLNNRAMNAIMKDVYASEYKYDIKPIALIHDAVYFMARNRLEVLHFLNELISKHMSWNELPEIQHPDVPLLANMDIHPLGWHTAVTMDNYCSKEDMYQKCVEYQREYLSKKEGK